MKTTIEFYYETDYAYGLIIKNDGGTQIQLRVDGHYDFKKQLRTSTGWDGAYKCGMNEEFTFNIRGDDNYYTVSLCGESGFGVICPINKDAYTFLKNIDLDKFVKLNLKMEFAD